MLVLALMMIQLGGGSSGSGLKLEEVYVKADALRYGAYKISRTYDAKKMQSVAIIRRSGRVLARHDHGEGLAGIEATHFGLFSLLGKNRKQLVVEQNSGGIHFCNSLWIYHLYHQFRLIFTCHYYPISDDWGESLLVDIDK